MGFSGNLQEFRQSLLSRKQRIEDAAGNTAREMVDILTRNTQPLARVKTGAWRDSIHGEASEVSPGIWTVWFGSKGVLSKDGFDYAAYWNFIDGTIDTGIFISQPEIDECQKRNIDAANAEG
ncbi:Uncharacterised protein [uncultured archaeon]|nr:Uncharacterised protein [uncultured archaeon]